MFLIVLDDKWKPQGFDVMRYFILGFVWSHTIYRLEIRILLE